MLQLFRLIAFLEGLSYILLLFIATPLKYLNDTPIYVKILGMPHGVFFILYVLFTLLLKNDMRWNLKQTSFILLASLLPFATFYVDFKYLRNK